MKNILTLLFCFCIIFSSFGFAESTKQQAAKNELNFVSSKTVVENEFPNIFRPIGNWFKRIFGKKQRITFEENASIKNLVLSRAEITSNCSINNSCPNDNQLISVSTEANNIENDVLDYRYEISGGKIIGKGEKAVWDLSGVKSGTYTITASVDDGVGLYLNPITKEVKVIECPNCN